MSDDVTVGPVILAPAIRGEAVGGYLGLAVKLGAMADLGHGLRVRGNVGRAFRAPSLGEL